MIPLDPILMFTGASFDIYGVHNYMYLYMTPARYEYPFTNSHINRQANRTPGFLLFAHFRVLQTNNRTIRCCRYEHYEFCTCLIQFFSLLDAVAR